MAKKNPLAPDYFDCEDRKEMEVPFQGEVIHQPPELTFHDSESRPVSLEGWYKGRSAFLICNGPSLSLVPLHELRRVGIVTMGMNNGWSVFRPDLWVCVDHPGNFIDTGWKDPGIMKFAPIGHRKRRLYVKKGDGNFRQSQFRVGQMPSVLFFARNERFNPDTFLTENTINWGCHANALDHNGHGGGRSVMLAAIRILHHMGVGHLYIVGADFKMVEGGRNYAFDQDRSKNAVNNNNTTFQRLNERLTSIYPQLVKSGMEVFNCTPDSGLTVFPFIPVQQAIKRATQECSKFVDTKGWYERSAKEKAAKKAKKLEEAAAHLSPEEQVALMKSKKEKTEIPVSTRGAV